jgi:hypothetical protein
MKVPCNTFRWHIVEGCLHYERMYITSDSCIQERWKVVQQLGTGAAPVLAAACEE